jgi:von Hippel-Lindau disease tumor supressor
LSLVPHARSQILSAKFFSDRNLLHSIFNGAYAVLLLIVVVFFLIYGVEVFFKIRGGFVYDAAITHTRGVENVNVNASQVHQSRIGLLSQAMMLMVIVGFLTSEMLGDFWKQKVPVHSRNWYDVMFRMVEVGESR